MLLKLSAQRCSCQRDSKDPGCCTVSIRKLSGGSVVKCLGRPRTSAVFLVICKRTYSIFLDVCFFDAIFHGKERIWAQLWDASKKCLAVGKKCAEHIRGAVEQ